MKQRIFHYTSVRALALILESRNFRFTRLDQFDDVYEAQSIGKFNFGQLLFASSWTTNEEEDLPQWSMYGDAMRGVRISLPLHPFEWHRYRPLPGDIAVETEIPMPMEQAIGETYKVHPFYDRSHFLQEVEYVDDVAAIWHTRVNLIGENSFVAEDPCALARFKGKAWSFQKEHRFVLMAQGRSSEHPNMTTLPPPPFMHIDLPMTNEALSSMHITLGPLRAPADRLIVEALAHKFSPTAEIKESKLLDAIRPR